MGRSVVQHWLLNLAIEVPCSLGTIFPSVEEEYLNVKKIAGCKPEEYGESLLELFEEGLIILKSDFAGDNVDNKDGVAQIVERFVRLPKDAREVRYASRTPIQLERHPSVRDSKSPKRAARNGKGVQNQTGIIISISVGTRATAKSSPKIVIS